MAYDIMVRERSRVTSSSQNIFCFCILFRHASSKPKWNPFRWRPQSRRIFWTWLSPRLGPRKVVFFFHGGLDKHCLVSTCSWGRRRRRRGNWDPGWVPGGVQAVCILEISPCIGNLRALWCAVLFVVHPFETSCSEFSIGSSGCKSEEERWDPWALQGPAKLWNVSKLRELNLNL